MKSEMNQAAGAGRAFVAALQAGEVSAVLDALHPEVEISEPDSLPFGGRWVGREGMVALFSAIASLATFSVDHCDLFADGDVVVLNHRATFGSKVDGEKYETWMCDVCRVEDGLIRTLDAYYKDVVSANEFFSRQ